PWAYAALPIPAERLASLRTRFHSFDGDALQATLLQHGASHLDKIFDERHELRILILMLHGDGHEKSAVFIEDCQGYTVFSTCRRALGVRFSFAIVAHVATRIDNRAGDRDELAFGFVMRQGQHPGKDKYGGDDFS